VFRASTGGTEDAYRPADGARAWDAHVENTRTQKMKDHSKNSPAGRVDPSRNGGRIVYAASYGDDSGRIRLTVVTFPSEESDDSSRVALDEIVMRILQAIATDRTGRAPETDSAEE